MNIEFLTEIYDTKDTYYYIVMAYEKPCLIGVPSLILKKRETHVGLEDTRLHDLTLLEVKELNNIPLDSNIFMDSGYPPFQLGLTVGHITNFIKADCDIKRLLNLALDKGVDFCDYYSMIKHIKEEDAL